MLGRVVNRRSGLETNDRKLRRGTDREVFDHRSGSKYRSMLLQYHNSGYCGWRKGRLMRGLSTNLVWGTEVVRMDIKMSARQEKGQLPSCHNWSSTRIGMDRVTVHMKRRLRVKLGIVEDAMTFSGLCHF